MYLRMGNLTPAQFAERVGSEFTADELLELAGMRSGNATLAGPNDFHIFCDPSISVTIGSRDCAALELFKAANARKQFNRPVDFDLDEAWSRKPVEEDA